MSLQYLGRLDPARQKIFNKLASFKDLFVLAGGTAVMLQIGHRKSFDFDCFTQNTLPKNLIQKAKRVFGRFFLRLVETSEQLTLKTSDNIEVTFVYHPYKPIRKPISSDSLPVFHLDDLVANKAYTIGRRGAWRDYVDLFFFLKWKLYRIETIISLAEKKFQGEFNPKLFLEQLTYFDDLNIVPTEYIEESYSDKHIQIFLGQQVEAYLQKIFPA